MNTAPLRNYLEAREALSRGNRTGAADLLASSFGVKVPTDFMIENLEALLEANDVSLTLILKESTNNEQ